MKIRAQHLEQFHFKNRRDAHSRAKRFHVCTDCLTNQHKTYRKCPACGSQNRIFFPSEAEFKRGMELLMLQSAGAIRDLRFHPRFDLIVNNQKITTYVADASYLITSENNILKVEDSKFKGNPKYYDPLSLVKMKLFEACYGIKVVIPQKKTTQTNQKELLP